ncbi:hypothetical protein ACIF8W_35130 [Streptomyces sp. NPDC085639]|uniref:hypothetical protein n=1 Tax=Streptomyces sp. NPDC085639 TaxID=3365734 RepID=UPI0037D4A840
MDAYVTTAGALGAAAGIIDMLGALAGWGLANAWWLALVLGARVIGWEALQRRLASRALAERTHLELVPSAGDHGVLL